MTLKLLIGVVAGGGLGLACYRFIGCSTGACRPTSNPVISALYGAAMSLLLAAGGR